jgi:hypothetical protein
MSRALIDVDCAIFNDPEESLLARDIGAMFNALRIFGLQVAGSAPTPNQAIWNGAPVVRLVVEELPGFKVLPGECGEGPRLIRPTFVVESHGNRRLIKVSEIWLSPEKPKLALVA